MQPPCQCPGCLLPFGYSLSKDRNVRLYISDGDALEEGPSCIHPHAAIHLWTLASLRFAENGTDGGPLILLRRACGPSIGQTRAPYCLFLGGWRFSPTLLHHYPSRQPLSARHHLRSSHPALDQERSFVRSASPLSACTPGLVFRATMAKILDPERLPRWDGSPMQTQILITVRYGLVQRNMEICIRRKKNPVSTGASSVPAAPEREASLSPYHHMCYLTTKLEVCLNFSL